ncbi:TPA: hypothetical protein RG395_002082 [Legionella pneumophila]|nr:DUF5681 domain-containing protein [Legionella pneumophila]HAT1846836.1 hypothetical protein [Legionella pneumophila]HAT1862006.1 hypothetical protein [Legionella pneumophila]HAT3975437.1 hypothetical protein [Legionella pneumophila]HAT8356700.1 hypothetical protein [Legionella pneumophila]HAU1206406.1 hypothetical protein [Legionella pneumophila]
MTFQAGKSGNPAGRPKGIIDKRVKLRAMLEEHAEDIISKLAELAKSGEPNALRLCVERLLPKTRLENNIYFELPKGRIDDYDNMLKIAQDVTQAVISGQLTMEEANKFANFLSRQRRDIDVVERRKQEEIEREEIMKAWRKKQCES